MDPLERHEGSTDLRSIPTSADIAWIPITPLPIDVPLVHLVSRPAANAVYAPFAPGDLISVPVFCWALVRAPRSMGRFYTGETGLGLKARGPVIC